MGGRPLRNTRRVRSPRRPETATATATATPGRAGDGAGLAGRPAKAPVGPRFAQSLIADDSENESDETFTVTLSNPSGADLGTAIATGTIRNRYVAPLTARFEGMPSEHDGGEFTFELHFSEQVKTGYPKVRDRAFTVDEGKIVEAKRKNPQAADRNKVWTIRVKPDGKERISITLPAAASCSDNKSICTHDERKLSHSTSASVAGPVGSSIADARVQEAAGAVLALTVSLSRSPTSSVTVDYATSDGTATAWADYTATSGTLTRQRRKNLGQHRRHRPRRLARRRRRDVDAHTLAPVEWNADRFDGHRNHREQRPDAAGAAGAVRADGSGARGRARGGAE